MGPRRRRRHLAVRPRTPTTTSLTVDGRRVDEDVLQEAALEIVAVRWAGHLRLPTATLDQTLDERGAVTDLDVTAGAPVHTGVDLDLVEERCCALAVAEAEDGLYGSAPGRRCRRLTLQLTPGCTAVRLQERDDHRAVEIVPCDDGVQAHVGFLLPLGEAARLDRWLTAAPCTVRRRHHRPASSVQVHLTVSARTLLGLDDDVTWRKVVLDPGTREVVDVGAREYRPSAALRRWVTTAHPTCAAPGCAVPSVDGDLDHVVPFADGGRTVVENLQPRERRARRSEHVRSLRLPVTDDPPPY